jgi:hypothetical protein
MSRAASLSDAMLAAGVPAGLCVRDTGAALSVVYAAGTTAGQMATGDALLAGFDGSDVAQAARDTAARRTAAIALAAAPDVGAQLLRAELLVTMDELNALRQWITSFKAATAAATTLADLKTRVAALANTPDRTAAQIKPALVSRVATPDAD